MLNSYFIHLMRNCTAATLLMHQCLHIYVQRCSKCYHLRTSNQDRHNILPPGHGTQHCWFIYQPRGSKPTEVVQQQGVQAFLHSYKRRITYDNNRKIQGLLFMINGRGNRTGSGIF